jgi:hypothetical protein
MHLDTYLAIVGIVLALVAIAVAVPPFIQMFWGAPKLSLGLSDDYHGSTKRLTVDVRSRMVTRKWLRKMNVIRQPTEALVDFSISEAGKTIVPMVRANLITEKEHGKQVTISTVFPAIFVPIICEDGNVKVVRDQEDEEILLKRGRYRIDIDLLFGHDRMIKGHAEFIVGDTPENSYWDTGSLRLDFSRG